MPHGTVKQLMQLLEYRGPPELLSYRLCLHLDNVAVNFNPLFVVQKMAIYQASARGFANSWGWDPHPSEVLLEPSVLAQLGLESLLAQETSREKVPLKCKLDPPASWEQPGAVPLSRDGKKRKLNVRESAQFRAESSRPRIQDSPGVQESRSPGVQESGALSPPLPGLMAAVESSDPGLSVAGALTTSVCRRRVCGKRCQEDIWLGESLQSLLAGGAPSPQEVALLQTPPPRASLKSPLKWTSLRGSAGRPALNDTDLESDSEFCSIDPYV